MFLPSRQRITTRLLAPTLLTTAAFAGALVPAATAAPASTTGTVVAVRTAASAAEGNELSTRALAKRKVQASRAKRLRMIPVKAMSVAKRQKGDPYRYGASGPSAFDCSGLTSYSYKRAGMTIPRTSGEQRAATKRINRAKARVGDLVFFHRAGRVYHVGLYAGGNRILHAPYTGARVRVEKIWTRKVSFGRVA